MRCAKSSTRSEWPHWHQTRSDSRNFRDRRTPPRKPARPAAAPTPSHPGIHRKRHHRRLQLDRGSDLEPRGGDQGQARLTRDHRQRPQVVGNLRNREPSPSRAFPEALRGAEEAQGQYRRVFPKLRLFQHRQHPGEPALFGLPEVEGSRGVKITREVVGAGRIPEWVWVLSSVKFGTLQVSQFRKNSIIHSSH